MLRAAYVKDDDFRPGTGAEGRAPEAVAAGDDGQEPSEAARAVAQVYMRRVTTFSGKNWPPWVWPARYRSYPCRAAGAMRSGSWSTAMLKDEASTAGMAWFG